MKKLFIVMALLGSTAANATPALLGDVLHFGIVHTILNEAVKSQDREPCTYVRVEHEQGNIFADGKRYTEKAVCK